MNRDFNHIESVYWVFTQLCNDTCDHCYNMSGPKGERISEEECMQIIDHLPPSMGRLILSGGEPLSRFDFFGLAERAKELKFRHLSLSTNGTLITEEEQR